MVDSSGRRNERDGGGSETRDSSGSETRDEVALVWYERGQRRYGRTSLRSSWKSADRGGMEGRACAHLGRVRTEAVVDSGGKTRRGHTRLVRAQAEKVDDGSDSGRMRDGGGGGGGETRDEVALVLYERGRRRGDDERKTALRSSCTSTDRGDGRQR